MHEYRILRFKRIASPFISPGKRVLNIGPKYSPSTYLEAPVNCWRGFLDGMWALCRDTVEVGASVCLFSKGGV
jgi:hypothetical protein